MFRVIVDFKKLTGVLINNNFPLNIIKTTTRQILNYDGFVNFKFPLDFQHNFVVLFIKRLKK